MPEPACPSCGETEALRGRPIEGDIAVTCQRCGAEWMRGEARCKKCGRAGGISAPQNMTRQPRGTLNSLIGTRQVPLCGYCDGDVLAAALERNQPVPEGYVSRFLFGEVAAQPAPEPRPDPAPRAASDLGRVTSQPRLASKPRPAATPPPAQLTDPTVRQATEAFLNDAGQPADGLTMVLLGTKLGASTRLTALDTGRTAAELGRWVRETFGNRPDRQRQAIDTLHRAAAHWTERQWLKVNITAELD